jgi:hypothetical protein
MAFMAIASAIYSYEEAENNADRMDAAAKEAADADMQMMALQQQQIDQNASDEKSAVAKAAQQRMAQLRVAAGESGIGGASVDKIMGEVDMDKAFDIAAIEGNRKNATAQNYAERGRIRATAQSRMNTTTRPSGLGTALQIGGSITNAYDNYKKSHPNTSGAYKSSGSNTYTPTDFSSWGK